MSNEMDIRRQAEEIVELMPRLMRRLLTVEPSVGADLQSPSVGADLQSRPDPASVGADLQSRPDPADDLPLAQLRVCSLLVGGDRSISCLSRELGITMSATTQLADRLERTGHGRTMRR